MLIQGALVTKTGSGEGCGATWPLCFGEVIPTNPAMETIIEYSHRLVSGIVGALVIVMAIWSWRQLRHMRETKFLSIVSVFMIIFQGLLGAGAVVFGQSDLIMALHFGFSALSFASVVLLTRLAFEDSKTGQPLIPRVSKAFRNYVLIVTIYSYAAIYTGAYVKHTEASLACNGFPLCNGQLFPALQGQVGAQVLHRAAAMVLVALLLILCVWVWKQYKHERVLVVSSVLTILLVLGQAASGISIVFTYNQVMSVGIFHALLISLLFTVLCYMTMIVTRKHR